jgi:hypothetical protein
MAERDVDRGRTTDIHVTARSSSAGAWIAGALVLLVIVGLAIWFLPIRGDAPAVAIERGGPDIIVAPAPAIGGGDAGGAAAGATAGGGAAGAVAGSADR